jgi:hypothetical protein
MLPSPLIYRAYSLYTLIRTLVVRIAALAGFIIAIRDFQQNPIVITLFCIACACCVLFIGDEQVDIYADRLVHRENSLWALIRNPEGKVFRLDQIAAAGLVSAPSLAETGVVTLMSFLVNRWPMTVRSAFSLELIHGQTVTIETRLARPQLKKIAQTVNSLLQAP